MNYNEWKKYINWISTFWGESAEIPYRYRDVGICSSPNYACCLQLHVVFVGTAGERGWTRRHFSWQLFINMLWAVLYQCARRLPSHFVSIIASECRKFQSFMLFMDNNVDAWSRNRFLADKSSWLFTIWKISFIKNKTKPKKNNNSITISNEDSWPWLCFLQFQCSPHSRAVCTKDACKCSLPHTP